MKKVICAACLLSALVFGGCSLSIPEISTSSPYQYEYQTTAGNLPEQTSGALPQEGTTEEYTTEEITVSAEVSTELQPVMPPLQETTLLSDVTEAASETVSVSPEMDLSISMPEKNGTMVTDKSADNKFIEIISDRRGIDPAYLVAVYAVPESGQNYVFEFSDEASRNVDSLKKVYLIDANGKITGVAAADASKKENLSSAENWFCMNVLIKGVIFPAIEKDIR